MSFGENLQIIRSKQNMTQEQMAEQLEVTRQSVSKWESGVGYPEMNTILRICELYQVSMDGLMRGTLIEKDEAEQRRFEKHMKSFARIIAGAVGMIIAATGLAAILDEVGVPDNISGMTFMSFVVIAVVMLIVSGMEHGRFVEKYPSVQPYHTEEEIDRFDKKFAWMIAGAVGAILIGIIIVCALDGTKSENTVGGGGFLMIVAVSVATMIIAGIEREIYHVEEYNKSNCPTKQDKKIGRVCGCIMILATIVFFLWGFLGSAPDWLTSYIDNDKIKASSGWAVSWMAFPVGGMLCGIASLILKKEDA